MTVLGNRIWLGFGFWISLFFTLQVKGQDPSATATVTLDEVALLAPKTATPASQLPLSISVQDLLSVQGSSHQLSLQEYLEAVPGLFAQNATNYAQDLRISIRGFGARAAFGIRGVKIIVDGLPETTPDGQGQLDNVPLGILRNLEVLRGPSASLYGNASGGVLYLNTMDTLENNTIQFQSRLGSYGFQSYQLNTGINKKKTLALFHASHTQTNGFRNFSGFEQSLFNFKVQQQLTSQSKVHFQLNYTHSPRAEDAGGLTLEETVADRRQERQLNSDFDAYESVDQFKTGLRWQQQWRSQWRLETYAFYNYRAFYGKLPFENGGIVDLNRNYYGFGSHLNYQQGRHRWQFAFETTEQADQRDRYNNLKGAQGALSFSQLERFGNTGLSVLDEIQWKNFLLRTSIRYDDLRLGADTVSQQQHYQVLNPSVGVSYKMAPFQQLYLRYASSFETPALSELSANPNGREGLNLALEPSRANNYELGWKGNWKKLKIEATGFYIKSSNEILPYELEAFPGRSFYSNQGATSRTGIEFFGSYQGKSWDVQASATQAQYHFLEGNNKRGKALPGLPNTQFFVQFNYQTSNHWQLLVTGVHYGAFYADSANSVAINPYQKVRVQASKKLLWKGQEFQLLGGINNLFNTSYFDNVRINAFGKRFYEPAPGRNFFVGLSLGI